ncbi:hypothetical protein ABH920_003815 [Catenulispora sp. EB89]|uniref:protein kinase domain-containing protein n=1 Tax=Catenulispora sp. EB89 TaxID=3156257 RepID=UPI0035145E3D
MATVTYYCEIDPDCPPQSKPGFCPRHPLEKLRRRRVSATDDVGPQSQDAAAGDLDTRYQVRVLGAYVVVPPEGLELGRGCAAVPGLADKAGIDDHHARIRCHGGRLSVMDLGSDNGTFIDGRRIDPMVEEPVAPGTSLRLADRVAVVIELADLDEFGLPRDNGAQAEPEPEPEPEEPASGSRTSASWFPDELLDRYVPEEEAGEGAEAMVWKARPADGGDPVAVKVYYAGQPMSTELVEYLRSDPAFIRHVPKILDSGRSHTSGGSRYWLVMEFFPESLADLIHRERAQPGGLSEVSAQALVAELANLITFWQQKVERNPLDFSPDNILVRRGLPTPQLVLADFGGVVAFRASQLISQARYKQAYAPPEEHWNDRAVPWPWWGLGEIVYEILTGRHRHEGQPDEVVFRSRHIGDLDLREVSSERWRMLLRGLLAREDRWTGQQVRDWLAGGSPPLPRQSSRPGGQPQGKELNYRGRGMRQTEDLARQMAADGTGADEWMADGGAARLAAWLKTAGSGYDTHDLAAVGRDPLRAAVAVTSFIATFAPKIEPRFQGRRADAAGLVEGLAREPGGSFAKILIDNRILSVAALADCHHTECADRDTCAVLERASALVNEAVPLAQRIADRVASDVPGTAAGAGTGWATGRGAASAVKPDEDAIYATALMLALEPTAVPDLRIGRGALGPRPADWWRELAADAGKADVRTARGIAAVAAAVSVQRIAAEDLQARKQKDPARAASARPWRPLPSTGALVGQVLLMVLACALLSWCAFVARGFFEVLTSDAVDKGHQLWLQIPLIAVRASSAQLGYLGFSLLAAVAAVAAAYGIGTTAPLRSVPPGVAVIAGMAGLVQPPSPVGLPQSAEQSLSRTLGHAAGSMNSGWVIVLSLAALGAGVAVIRGAESVSGLSGANGSPFTAGRTPAALIGVPGWFGERSNQYRTRALVIGGAVLFLVLSAAAWTGAVAQREMFPAAPAVTVPPAPRGAVHAAAVAPLPDPSALVGRYALVLAVLAVAVTLLSRQRRGWVVWPAAVAVGAAAWLVSPSLPLALGGPVLPGLTGWLWRTTDTAAVWYAWVTALLLVCLLLPTLRRSFDNAGRTGR